MTETKSTTEEQPKKKGHGCLIAFLIFLFLILSIIGGGYWLYKKITSDLSTQMNLDVSYAQSDFDSLMANVGIAVDPAKLCLDCTMPEFSAPESVDLTVTSAQATAFVNVTSEYMESASLEDTNIKFSDEKAEISTLLTFQGQTFPVYASGNVAKATATSVAVNLYDVKVGNISVPKAIQDYVENALETITNEKLSDFGDTLRIDDIGFTSSGLHIAGLIPSKGE